MGRNTPERYTRPSLDELEPELRKRLLALDEPVARDDWQDVLKRSRTHLPSRIRSAAVVAVIAAATLALGPGVASQLLSGLRGSTRGASSATETRSSLTHLAGIALGSTVPAPTTIRVIDTTRSLYVSPTKEGGFCYRWTGIPSACEELDTTPLRVTWMNGRLIGSVSSKRLSSVQIKFTDGTVVAPEISWVAAPINAGFFLYHIPPGKTVADITGYDGHETLGQVTWFTI